MGKHKRRRDSEEFRQPNMQPQNNMQPNMFNQNALMQMLGGMGNMDMNGLSGMIKALNNSGINLNNFNMKNSNLGGGVNENIDEEDEKTIQLLNSLKPFLPPRSVEIIDKVIDMYLSEEDEADE